MTNEKPSKGGTYTVDPKTGKLQLEPGSATEPQPTQAELEAVTAPTPAVPAVEKPKAFEPAPETTSKP
jgi:hypothetical protein